MKAFYTNNNIQKKLIVGDKPKPSVGRGRVLVRMHAASINPIDWRFIGLIAPVFPWSMILGHDGAGEVVAVGKGVTRFKVGDKVWGLKVWAFRGTFAEYCLFAENELALIPRVAIADAAALPLVGLTALQGFAWAELKAGQKVLIIGGSGGVGHVAVQVAKALGAHVTAVCSTRNLEFVKGLGADVVVDYTTTRLLDIQTQFDVILDTVGQSSFRSLTPILKPSGKYVTTLPNARSGVEILLSETLGRLWANLKRSYFIVLKAKPSDLEALNQLVEQGKLKVVIDKQFSFEELPAAIAASKTARTTGKNVVLIA